MTYMRNTSLLTLLFLSLIFSLSANKTCLNKDWIFFYGDIPEARYADYDDSEWRVQNLPHDWAFENGYSANAHKKIRGLSWWRYRMV